ncbi:hypothetical protein AS156_23050 [Bradyrhizobium macuxiense]|uniref:Uncharacterized protein n=1 Tax=Bradyrhizobium macuxiense TaxID=1755647 RepID=A0A109JBI2_9BRAD|nr:hypothetical protein [Bradyrhizobium macuxiense]KWV45893.1 hypothetical protein AS156_23050 [Bradyrhizobium macuxiense]
MQAAQAPQDSWIPIGLAIFRFGIAGSDDSVTSEAPIAGADLFSKKAFEQAKGREGVSRIGYEPKPPTLEDLAEHLRKHTGAYRAEIDRRDGSFLFSFPVPGGGEVSRGGAPWAILREPDEPPELNPRIAALLSSSGLASDQEAPYEGFAKIGAIEAAEGARQSEAVRFATGLVWRRFMLPAFDRAVDAGRVTLYARVPSPRDDFQRLPTDIWSQLEIVDWELGVARDIQGTLYSSIHVADAASPITATQVGRSSKNPKDDEPSALHQQIREAVEEIRLSGGVPARVKERDAAIAAWFRGKNQTPPSERSIRRALADASPTGGEAVPHRETRRTDDLKHHGESE